MAKVSRTKSNAFQQKSYVVNLSHSHFLIKKIRRSKNFRCINKKIWVKSLETLSLIFTDFKCCTFTFFIQSTATRLKSLKKNEKLLFFFLVSYNYCIVVASNNITRYLFEYLMPMLMSHGVKKKTPPSPPSHPPPFTPTRFSPGLFVALQEIPCQLSFVLMRLLRKIMDFQRKTNFFSQLIAGQL